MIDIFITVYNAYDETRLCVESVIENTKDIDYVLYILDDCSPDIRIEKYFTSLVRKKGSKIVYVRNEKNLGYLKNINKGLKLSKSNDVVILNSDVIVSRHWLYYMHRSVINYPHDVAVCMPLSNNATIYSLSRYSNCELLDCFSINDISEVLFKNSLNINPRIPTAVGFCIYITRKSLNMLYPFDEEFGVGYGEENDFCMRAYKKGFFNILCDSSFVYHKGHVSMKAASILKEEKEGTLTENELILNKKHPDYIFKVNQFLVNDHSLQKITNNLMINLIPRNSIRKILYVLHNYEDTNVLGGTELHVSDLVNEFSKNNIVYVLYPHDGDLILIEKYKNIELKYRFPVNYSFYYPEVLNNLYKKVLIHIIDIFNFDIAHIHHTMNLGFDIFSILKDRNIPIVYTIHDYYIVSPSPKLTDTNGIYLGLPIKVHYWNSQLREFLNDMSFNISLWQKEVFSQISLSSLLIFPSKSAKDIIKKVYPSLDGKVIEHGVKFPELNGVTYVPEIGNKNIAFIGHIHYKEKGFSIIRSSLLNLVQKGYHVFIWGSSAKDLHLDDKIATGITIFGKYNRSDISRNLIEYKINLVCLLSSWPETYSYVLTESWLAGIPVLVSNFGAQRDRVLDRNLGYVLKKYTKSEFLRMIDSIFEDEKKYRLILQNIHNTKFKNLAQMYAEYSQEYTKLCNNSEVSKTKMNYNIGENHLLLYTLSNENSNLRVALNDMNNERLRLIDVISEKDKIISKIHKFRFIYAPFKSLFKNLFK